MANQEHVDRLNDSTVAEWNYWRFENSGIKPDLSGADLRGADLRNANFRRANLSVAIASKANFSGADLSMADLNGAFLDKANLSRTIFFDTNLTGALHLENCQHNGPSVVDHLTLRKSSVLPPVFLRGCGLPDRIIEHYPSLLNQPISFNSCFISYSSDDKAFARRLHDQLQGIGIRCWLDEHQLLPGDDVFEQIDQGNKHWDKVLLCASESALTSWWVDNEIDAAFEKEQSLIKQHPKKFWSLLILLDLDGYIFGDQWDKGNSGHVKSRLAAEFKGWENDNSTFEKEFEKTVKAITNW